MAKKKAKANGGGPPPPPPVYVDRTILWYDNGLLTGNLVAWQDVTILVPTGASFNDYAQGTCSVSAIGPLFTSPGGPPYAPTRPITNAVAIISPLPGIPWWYLAGQGMTPIGISPKPNTATTPPYYY